MPIDIPCIYNHHGAWCKNEKVKLSAYGLGPRHCMEYDVLKRKCPYMYLPILAKKTKESEV